MFTSKMSTLDLIDCIFNFEGMRSRSPTGSREEIFPKASVESEHELFDQEIRQSSIVEES